MQRRAELLLKFMLQIQINRAMRNFTSLRKNKITDSPNDTRKQPMGNCIRTQPSDLATLKLQQNLKLVITELNNDKFSLSINL